MCVNTEQLELLDLENFALELRKGHGIGFVYGCTVAIEFLKSGADFENKDKVDKFAEQFGFDKPEFFSAMYGDFDADKYYKLDKEKFKEVFGEYFEEDQ